MAVFRDQPEAQRLLLAAGADPNVAGDEGDTPLRFAIEEGDAATAERLLNAGADATINAAGGPSGMSALGRAAFTSRIDLVELLLAAGADPHAADVDRRKPRELIQPGPHADRLHALLGDS